MNPKPPKHIQIMTLESGEHRVVLPIDAFWYQKGEKEFVAWAETVEIYGKGRSPGDAVRDLKKKLLDKHIELQAAQPSSLIDKERAWREYLGDRIKEKKRRRYEWDY